MTITSINIDNDESGYMVDIIVGPIVINKLTGHAKTKTKTIVRKAKSLYSSMGYKVIITDHTGDFPEFEEQ